MKKIRSLQALHCFAEEAKNAEALSEKEFFLLIGRLVGRLSREFSGEVKQGS